MTKSNLAWSRESLWLRLPGAAVKDFSPDWAFGGATGRNVRVAVIDSGIEASHPAVHGAIDEAGSVEFSIDAYGRIGCRIGPHDDVYGHGTACAGIIHALAPEARITSVRVLDEGLRGRAAIFHAGLTWAVEQEFDVINLSLGAAKRDWALAFHDTCDRGYFANSFIVTAANNINRDSFPSLFASVTSVASNNSSDPLRFHFNPEPPTEFLARGIDVEVPWIGGSTIVTTGNSFAAPHIAAFAALIKGKHPDLRSFQLKTALWAASANVREATMTDRAGRGTRPTLGPYRTTIRATHRLGGQGVDSPVTEPGGDPGSIRGATPPVAGLSEQDQIQSLMDDYEVGELLTRGPWGPVFSATRNGVAVALRLLDPRLAVDGPTRDRFAASVRTAATLHHRHILDVLELRENDYFAVIATPLCPSDLEQWLKANDPDLAAAIVVALSLLGALDAAHAAGIYHGDLRPENAMIDKTNRVLLSDVGIAAALTSDIRTSSAPNDPLSWTYLAPEQLEGGAIGAFTDIYAVGLLLYEVASGALPHPAVANLGSLVRQRADARPRRLQQLIAEVPAAIADIADQAVAEKPAERPRSALAMSEALTQAAEVTLGPDWMKGQPFVLETSTEKRWSGQGRRKRDDRPAPGSAQRTA